MNISIAQGIVAIIVIGGAVAFAILQLLRGQNPVPPDWLTLSVGAIIGYFFANNSQQLTTILQQRSTQNTIDAVSKIQSGSSTNGNGVH